MWELDYKGSWALKTWCFWTVVLEKTLESPLACQEIQPVHPKGDQSWIFIEGLMLKLKLNILATWCEELTYWKRPWCWERLKVGGEGDDREWDGWMVSLMLWTWVWVGSKADGLLEVWRATIHGVAKSWTWLSNWPELNWTCLIISRKGFFSLGTIGILDQIIHLRVTVLCIVGCLVASLLHIH